MVFNLNECFFNTGYNIAILFFSHVLLVFSSSFKLCPPVHAVDDISTSHNL